jgi:FKBP-type peptidyl-prolyl cis-trans isomerase FkpA
MATSKFVLLTLPLALASSLALAQASAPVGGLGYKSLKDGSGPSPAATDVVRVHYRGTFPDGKEFDSSHKRGQPAEFPLNRVIKCWTEGVQKMKVGGKVQLVCPPGIAYGERGTPGGPIPPNATLHFEIELLGIVGK